MINVLFKVSWIECILPLPEIHVHIFFFKHKSFISCIYLVVYNGMNYNNCTAFELTVWIRRPSFWCTGRLSSGSGSWISVWCQTSHPCHLVSLKLTHSQDLLCLVKSINNAHTCTCTNPIQCSWLNVSSQSWIWHFTTPSVVNIPLRALWILWFCHESSNSNICSNRSKYGRNSYVYE